MYKKRKSKMLADGGIMQEGGTVDEVSGNDVPLGSLKEEVRDDVDAKLSPGEYVFPADVTRYYGIAKLEAMRKEAQDGLMKMEQGGRMGNAEQVSEEAVDSYDNDEEFSKSVDQAMSEHDSETGYNKGGVVKHYVTGGGVPYDPATNTEIYKRAPIKGFEMIPMEDDDGNRIFIPFINGRPQLAVPAGYRIRAAKGSETVTDKTKTTTTDTSVTENKEGPGSVDVGINNNRGVSASPSGPDELGLGPAQDRSPWRDTLNSIPTPVSLALSMVPVVGTALSIAKAADWALTKYDEAQLAPSLTTREKAQDAFRAFEISDMNAAAKNTAQQSFQMSEKSILDAAIALSVDKNISPKAALDSILSDNDESTRDDTSSPIGNMGGIAPLGSGMRAADKASEGDVIVGTPITRSNISARPIDAEATFTPFTGIDQDFSANISGVNTGTGGKGSTNTGTSGGTPGTAESIDVGGALAGGGMEGVDFGGYSAEGYQ